MAEKNKRKEQLSQGLPILKNRAMTREESLNSSLDVGIENGVVDKKGAWLQFDGELIGQGKDAAQKAMVEKPALAKKIVDAILAKRAAAPAAN